MRKITVFSTRGKSGNFETEATTWGEIISKVENIVGDLTNLKATENINKTTLEHVDAKLPEGDFRIFLRPEKTKSGYYSIDINELSYKECKDYVMQASKECKDFLNAKCAGHCRNWTNLNAVELRKYLIDYNNTISATIEESDDTYLDKKIKEIKHLLENLKVDFDVQRIETSRAENEYKVKIFFKKEDEEEEEEEDDVLNEDDILEEEFRNLEKGFTK